MTLRTNGVRETYDDVISKLLFAWVALAVLGGGGQNNQSQPHFLMAWKTVDPHC